jgi:pimeloyl-ACP methyl ester carboxylesterase
VPTARDNRPVTRRRCLPALALVALLLATPAAARAAPRERDCDGVRCFRLSVPLDRSGRVPGRVSLLVHRRPAARRPRRGITFLLAGGPGQSAISAFGPTFSFLEQPYEEWSDLTPRNDVVVFDQRGTGHSGLLRCRDLQAANPVDASRPAEACATVLGRRRAFYRTSDTVEDMEAIRRALGAPRVTVIGVSYGTYVAQRYGIAYPGRVQRLVLDSVVDPGGLDPLEVDSFASVHRILADLCRPRCRFTRDAAADTAALVARLARAPLRGKVVLPSGRPRPASLTRQDLWLALAAGDLTDLLRSDYPGAVVAALRGDSAPLLRLERRALDSESFQSVRDFSAGVYASTLCEELDFSWIRGTPFAERPSRAFAAASEAGSRLAPFDAWTSAGDDVIRLCRRWPTASAEEPALAGPLPNVPVLLLAGGQDTRTPLETARGAAARWPRARLVTAPSHGHSLLSENGGCATRAVRRFIRGGAVPSRCPREEELRPTPPPPTSLREVRPLPGSSGIRGRALRAMELTVDDASTELLLEFIARFEDLFRGRPVGLRVPGLRGGYMALQLARETLVLHRLEYVPGVRLSGKFRPVEKGPAKVRLRLSGPGTPDGVVRVVGNRVRGRLGGRRVSGRLAGPTVELEDTEIKTLAARRARARGALRSGVPPWALHRLIMGR